MKHFLLFFLTSIMLFKAAAQESTIMVVNIYKRVDVFSQHIKILDSVMNFGRHDRSPKKIINSVEYMERVTHIKAHGDCMYVVYYFTWLDLSLWKAWYKNIGAKRIGIVL